MAGCKLMATCCCYLMAGNLLMPSCCMVLYACVVLNHYKCWEETTAGWDEQSYGNAKEDGGGGVRMRGDEEVRTKKKERKKS